MKQNNPSQSTYGYPSGAGGSRTPTSHSEKALQHQVRQTSSGVARGYPTTHIAPTAVSASWGAPAQDHSLQYPTQSPRHTNSRSLPLVPVDQSQSISANHWQATQQAQPTDPTSVGYPGPDPSQPIHGARPAFSSRSGWPGGIAGSPMAYSHHREPSYDLVQLACHGQAESLPTPILTPAAAEALASAHGLPLKYRHSDYEAAAARARGPFPPGQSPFVALAPILATDYAASEDPSPALSDAESHSSEKWFTCTIISSRDPSLNSRWVQWSHRGPGQNGSGERGPQAIKDLLGMAFPELDKSRLPRHDTMDKWSKRALKKMRDDCQGQSASLYEMKTQWYVAEHGTWKWDLGDWSVQGEARQL